MFTASAVSEKTPLSSSSPVSFCFRTTIDSDNDEQNRLCSIADVDDSKFHNKPVSSFISNFALNTLGMISVLCFLIITTIGLPLMPFKNQNIVSVNEIYETKKIVISQKRSYDLSCLFPAKFTWGVATSAYQIEGAVSEDGRGETIWDVFVRQPGVIFDNSTAEIADDHYHQWKDDIALMKSLNIKAYRFSVAWSRILPDGVVREDGVNNSSINRAGIKFYNNLIDELIRNDIQPWITLYHWDLPNWIQENYDNGWLDRRTVDAFGNYSRIAFSFFGDRVKHFITINEAWTVAVNGHCTGIHAPGRKDNPQVEPYIVGHHLLLAHAKAYRIYHSEFAAYQHGMVGIANSGDFRYPKRSNYHADEDAAERAMLFQFGWFVDPILRSGDYPEIMRQRLGDRLPAFSSSEQLDLAGSTDFLGLNYYSSLLAAEPEHEAIYSGYWADIFVNFSDDPSWDHNDMGWNVVPEGLEKMLLWISKRYDFPLLYVTENGSANFEPTFEAAQHDEKRTSYMENHLTAAGQAIANYGVNLAGFFAWSLLDNFEWQFGYQRRFGICRVDFNTQERMPKMSAFWYRDLITCHEANEINAGKNN